MLQPLSTNAPSPNISTKAKETEPDGSDPAFALVMASMMPIRSNSAPQYNKQAASEKESRAEPNDRAISQVSNENKAPSVRQPQSDTSDEKVDKASQAHSETDATTSTSISQKKTPAQTEENSKDAKYAAVNTNAEPRSASSAVSYRYETSAASPQGLNTGDAVSKASEGDAQSAPVTADAPIPENPSDPNAATTYSVYDFKSQLNHEINTLMQQTSGSGIKQMDSITANLSTNNHIFITEQGKQNTDSAQALKPEPQDKNTIKQEAIQQISINKEKLAQPMFRELLSVPKPEMEVPRPLQGLSAKNSSEAITIKAPSIALVPPAAVQTGSNNPGENPDRLFPGTGSNPLANIEESKDTTKLLGKNILHTGGQSFSENVLSPTTLNGITPQIQNRSLSTSTMDFLSEKTLSNPAAFTQMDSSIKWMVANNVKGAEIQLNPESLGKLVIQLKVEGGEVHAKLWASESATVPILQEQRPALEASLRQQGLSLGSFDLQQGSQDGTRFANHFMNHSSPGLTKEGSVHSGLSVERVPTQANLGGARIIEVFA